MKRILLIAGLIAFSQAASAHTGLLPTGGFSHGFQHPFLGLDHFLAMLGLGLWASGQSRSLARQAIGVFLSFMIVGALLGLAGFGFAYVETAILFSLLLVGVALSFGTARLSEAVILTSIAAFASMHGLAHGSEMPVDASAYAYIGGFVSATAVLHVSGLALGWIAQRINVAGLIHIYGTMTGLIGAWLLLA
ncbi:HupE/UreJ family protein [Methylobacter sp.]|uniref:HupE/UreJ family protein n=1 Tax=Methylobacter sp. TaxID=2051955 RepID=UPI002FDC7E15